MKKRKNPWICRFGMLLLLAGLSGCGRKTGEDPETIRVAYHSNFGGASAVSAAMDQHYFEEEGLKVELLEFSSGLPSVAALEAGDVDISFLGHGAFSYVMEGKVRIIAVDSLSNAEEIMTRKDTGIRKPEDLIGKKIATTYGTSSENFLKAALASYGISAEDVEIVNMDIAGAAMALVKGKVDAAAIWAPYTNEVRQYLGEDAVTVINCMDFRDTLALPMSWVASEESINSRRDTIVRFVRALYRGMDYRNDNLTETAELVAKRLGMESGLIAPDVNTAVWFDSGTAKQYAEDGSFEKWYRELGEFMSREQGLEAFCQPEEYLYLDIIEEAVSGIGE